MTNKEKAEQRFCIAGITGDKAFDEAKRKMEEYSESLKKKGHKNGTGNKD